MIQVDYDDSKEFVQETTRGIIGRRVARNIRTRDVSLLVSDPDASNLPVKGDSWDGTLTLLKVSARRFEPEPNALDYVTCEISYETPGFGSVDEPLPQRVPYTSIEAQTSGVTQLATLTLGANDDDPDDVGVDSRTIGDGRGVSRDVGYTRLLVYDPVEGWGQFNQLLPKLVRFQTLQAINREGLTFPAYEQALNAGTFQLGPGQVRYNTYRITKPDELGKFWIVHTLLIAEDHLVRWTNEAPEGTSPFVFDGAIYPRQTYGQLWKLA